MGMACFALRFACIVLLCPSPNSKTALESNLTLGRVASDHTLINTPTLRVLSPRFLGSLREHQAAFPGQHWESRRIMVILPKVHPPILSHSCALCKHLGKLVSKGSAEARNDKARQCSAEIILNFDYTA